MNILFLDVDGPLIPARMYYAGLPRHPVTAQWMYDPVAINMIMTLAIKYDLKIVYNSSHNAGGAELMFAQAKANHLDKRLHPEEWITKFPLGFIRRIDGISEWLSRHPEAEKWAVVDDAPVGGNQVLVDYHHGITLDNYEQLERFYA